MFIERFTKRRREKKEKRKETWEQEKKAKSYIKCFLVSDPPNVSIHPSVCLVLHIVCIHEIETRCLIFLEEQQKQNRFPHAK